jgi:glycosyltransferase involved in cell wall biosynthesis
MKKSLVTIGIPVYNGELLMKKCIESVLSQTYENFELIISDNASTDSTPDICKEFLKKDNRITFVRQNENMGQNWNFNFPLEKANGEYFVWLVADAIISPEFIEKNIAVLESQDNAVGCISKIKIDHTCVDKFKTEKEVLKKIGLVYRPNNSYSGEGTLPITGNYVERIRKYLKYFPWEMMQAVYRTKPLRESSIHDFFLGWDASLVLNILKHGEIKVVNQFLLESFPSYGSSEALMQVKQKSHGKYSKTTKSNTAQIFPFYPLTKWCVKNLGWKIFFRNIDHFLRLSLDGLIIQIASIYQNMKT